MGVRSWEPEGSLVKICSEIAETLLTLVIRLLFFPSAVEASSNRIEGSVGLVGVEAKLRGNSSLHVSN